MPMSVAANKVGASGMIVVSNRRCAIAARMAVAAQKPATVAVGTPGKRRDSTEYSAHTAPAPAANM